MWATDGTTGTAAHRLALTVAGALVGALAVAGCGLGGGSPDTAPASVPSPSTSTLTPIPAPPEPPPSGRLLADLRQSSRDAALGRIQVWLDNDTRAEVVPGRITYRDPRLRRPLRAGRLRPAPAGAERGYPLDLPGRPRCGQRGGAGVLEVRHGGRRTTVPVEDPVDVVGRWARSRCLELEVAEVVTLRWSDRVVEPEDRPVRPGDTGTLTLVLTPTGAAGQRLVVDSVGGTPVLSPADGASAWAPGAAVDGGGAPVRVDLPVRPARCDGHAFLESGGATAFRLRLRLERPGRAPREGELVLRMAPEAAGNALAFAVASCGVG